MSVTSTVPVVLEPDAQTFAEATRHGGATHDFMMPDATRNTHGAQSATAEAIEFIRDHLGT